MPAELRALEVPFNQGKVTARPPEALAPGELVEAIGLIYRPGDTVRAHKRPGRTLFGDTGITGRIKGMAHLAFDDGEDRLVVYIGNYLLSATPGLAGTFSDLYAADVVGGIGTGGNPFSDAGTVLAAVQYNDRWYLGNGVDRNVVVPPTFDPASGDQFLRYDGLNAPSRAPKAAASNGPGASGRPTLSTGDFDDPELAYDALAGTFASATLNGPSEATGTWYGWASNTDTGRRLIVSKRLAGYYVSGSGDPASTGSGATSDAGYKVNINLQLSLDDGATFTDYLIQVGATRSAPGAVEIEVAIPDAINSNLVRFRALVECVSGTSAASFLIPDIRIQSGATIAAFTPTVGFYYAMAFYNAKENLEGPIGPVSQLINGGTPGAPGAMNQALITNVANIAASEINVTHIRLYRTTQDAGGIESMFLVKESPVDAATILDDFSIAPDVKTLNLVPLKTYESNQGTIRVPLNSPAPAFFHMNIWDGRRIGLRRDARRQIHASEPGLPESFPETNVIVNFDIPQHEVILSTATVGRALMIGMTEAIHVLSQFPDVVNGQFNGGEAHPLPGQPGLVSEQGMVSWSVGGEPRASWVSRFGIHWTNGATSGKLTTDLDWPADVSQDTLASSVLKYLPQHESLLFEYDGDGDGLNDAWLLLQMSPEHRKDNGTPKITQGYGQFSAFALGQVDGVYRLWSGHETSGRIYLEDSGGTDESEAYSFTILPLRVTTGQLDVNGRRLKVVRGRLRHSDFGDGEVGYLRWLATMEDTQSVDQLNDQAVALSGSGASPFGVARMADLHQMTVIHEGPGLGALTQAELFVTPGGQR